MAFDVIDESLRLTNLVELKSTHLVNLERAASFGDEIVAICYQGTFKLKRHSPSDTKP